MLDHDFTLYRYALNIQVATWLSFYKDYYLIQILLFYPSGTVRKIEWQRSFEKLHDYFSIRRHQEKIVACHLTYPGGTEARFSQVEQTENKTLLHVSNYCHY